MNDSNELEPLSLQEADRLRSQVDAMSAMRARQLSRFARYFLGSWAALFFGVLFGGVTGNVGGYFTVLSVILVLVLQGVAAAALAKAKGEHAAWGWGALFSIITLFCREDRTQARLTEWTCRLEGKPLPEKQDWRLSWSLSLVIWSLAPWVAEMLGWQRSHLVGAWSRFWPIPLAFTGVALAALVLRSQLRLHKPPTRALWYLLATTCGATAVLVLQLDRINHPPIPAPKFRGQFVVTLPADWTESSFGNSDTKKEVDFVARRANDLTLVATSFPKLSPRPVLREFAERTLEDWRKMRGAGASWTGPEDRLQQRNGKLFYRLRMAAAGENDTTIVACFFDDQKGPCMVEVSGDTDFVAARRAEVMAAIDGVRSLNP